MAEQTGKDASAKRGLNRRSVVKGAAWSVPAVVVASAAPAMASASDPVVIDFGNSTACKVPGASWGSLGYDKGYVLWAQFENNSSVDLWVKVTSISLGTAPNLVPLCLVGMVDTTNSTNCAPTATTSCVKVPANDSITVGVFGNTNSNSSPERVTVGFDYFEGSNCSGVKSSTSQYGDVNNGASWTSGGGSCGTQGKFPSGYTCRTPPSATAAGC